MWYEKGIQINKSTAAIIGGVVLGAIIGVVVGWIYTSLLIPDSLAANCVNMQSEITLTECQLFAFAYTLIVLFAMISGAIEGAIVTIISGSIKATIGGMIIVSLVGAFVAGVASNGEAALYGALISASAATLVGVVVWLIARVIRKRSNSKPVP